MFCVLCAVGRFIRRKYYRTKYKLLGRRPSYYIIFVGVHIRRAAAESPGVSLPGLKAHVLPRYMEFKRLPKSQQRVIIAGLAREAGLDRRARLALALDRFLP